MYSYFHSVDIYEINRAHSGMLTQVRGGAPGDESGERGGEHDQRQGERFEAVSTSLYTGL